MLVVICGGGSGVLVLAALTGSNRNIESRVLNLNEKRADLWNKALENNHGLSCCFTNHLGLDVEIHSKPHIVSNDPSEVVPGADVIFITVPAWSHEKYLKAIEPYIKVPIIIIGFPGQPGFEFQSQFILKDKLHLLTIMSAESLPWACRIVDDGIKVRIIGIKKCVQVATVYDKAQRNISPLEVLESVIGPEPIFVPIKHFLKASLVSPVLHSCLMYAKWKKWNGLPLSEKPLFYHGIDDDGVKCIFDMEQETLCIAKQILKQNPDIDLTGDTSNLEWLVTSYGSTIGDPSSLKRALVSNKAYDGLTHPMKYGDGGFVPDFTNRYLSEDIPFGLVVTKGWAQLVGVETPLIDEAIRWAQKKLDKEYIVGTELTGKHLSETRAPQVYGITSLDDLDKFVRTVDSGMNAMLQTGRCVTESRSYYK